MRAALWAAVLSMACGRQAAAPAPAPAAAKAKQAECGQASDETLRIMRGLAPNCEGCHITGTRAFFSSVGAFQNLIAADPRMVIPGDPDNSEFIKLLEGRSSGAFSKMPIGTKSYAQLVADGAASLTVEEVKQWIRGLATQGRDARPDPTAARITRVKAEQVQRALYQQLGLGYDDFFFNTSDYGVPLADPRTDETYPFQPADSYLVPRRQQPVERFHALGGGSVIDQHQSDTSPAPTFALTITQVSQRWCRLSLGKQNGLALFPNGTTQATTEANVKATIARWFVHFHGTRAQPADIDAMYSTVWAPLFATSAEAGWVGLCSAFIRHPDWIFY